MAKERNFESASDSEPMNLAFPSAESHSFYIVVPLVQYFDASIWIDGILRCGIV